MRSISSDTSIGNIRASRWSTMAKLLSFASTAETDGTDTVTSQASSRGWQLSAARTCEQLDHRRVERWYVVGLATCGQALINNHLLIHPFRASILEVSLERWPGCHAPGACRSRFDDRPGPMANRGHGLAAIKERLCERDGFWQHPQRVRVHHPARQHRGVEVLRPGAAQWEIDRKLVAPLRKPPGLHPFFLGRDNFGFCPGIVERFARFGHFDLLRTVRDQQANLQAVQ